MDKKSNLGKFIDLVKFGKIVKDNAKLLKWTSITALCAGTSVEAYRNVKKNAILEKYKGWEIWKEGKYLIAEKGKEQLRIEDEKYEDIKKLIDAKEE